MSKYNLDRVNKTLYIATAIFLVLLVIGIIETARPYCPIDYTQAQVDAANCEVGAKIRIDLFITIPLGIVVICAWVQKLIRRNKNSSN